MHIYLLVGACIYTFLLLGKTQSGFTLFQDREAWLSRGSCRKYGELRIDLELNMNLNWHCADITEKGKHSTWLWERTVLLFLGHSVVSPCLLPGYFVHNSINNPNGIPGKAESQTLDTPCTLQWLGYLCDQECQAVDSGQSRQIWMVPSPSPC